MKLRKVTEMQKLVLARLEALGERQKDLVFKALRIDPENMQIRIESDFIQHSEEEPTSQI